MEKVWVSSYPDGVPAEINPDAYSSVKDLFMVSCAKFDKCIAYEHMGSEMTFTELFRLSHDFAAFCQHRLGLQKGDCMGLMMPNMMQYPVALFGAWMAGLTVININPLYSAQEVVSQLSRLEVRCVVVLENFANTLALAKKTIAIPHVIVTGLGDLLHFPKSMFVNFAIKYVKRMIPSYSIPATITFTEALLQGKECELAQVEVNGDDVALLQPTGGTTGTPKSAIITHRNLVANLEQMHAWVTSVIEAGKESIVTALPMYHIFSLTVNVLLFMKEGGRNILITDPRNISALVRTLRKNTFTLMTGVNTLYNALNHHPGFKKCDFSQFKLSISGGMAMQEEVAKTFEKITQKPLLEGYGLTEASPVVSVTSMTRKHFDGSIGLPLPSTNIKIIDDAGNECPIGAPGELCVQGPQVMRAYFNNAEESQKVLTQDGWLLTGDIAVVDEKGVITLVDRKKDMIIVSGFNVYPNEVEAVIMHMPAVLEVAVVGVPSKESGETVKAVIVKDASALSAADVINHCRAHLAHYKAPHIVEFVDALPKNNVGKVLRRELKH